MKERLSELYKDGIIDDVSLGIAVNKRWISEEEKASIIASK